MIPLLRNAFVQIKVVMANEEIMAEAKYFFNTNYSVFVWKQHQIVPSALLSQRETWDMYYLS